MEGKKAVVIYGCEEWQEREEFQSKEKAEEFIEKVESGGVSYGLYPAKWAHIDE